MEWEGKEKDPPNMWNYLLSALVWQRGVAQPVLPSLFAAGYGKGPGKETDHITPHFLPSEANYSGSSCSSQHWAGTLCLFQEARGPSAVCKQVGRGRKPILTDVFPILHMPVGRNVKDQVFPLLSIPINVEGRAGLFDLRIVQTPNWNCLCEM